MPTHIVLYQPVIPQNTGSISRLCACTGATLHLIHPLGFRIDEAAVKRAGLDYWAHVDIRSHNNWEAFLENERPEHIFFLTKFAHRSYTEVQFPIDSYLVFGSETTGLPDLLHKTYADKLLRIPMRTHLVRSLNLSQAAGIVLYEVLRQNNSLDSPISI